MTKKKTSIKSLVKGSSKASKILAVNPLLTGYHFRQGLMGGGTSGFFNPPVKQIKTRKPTIKNLTTTINNQIKLKKQINQLKNKLFTEQQKEKEIRKSLEENHD